MHRFILQIVLALALLSSWTVQALPASPDLKEIKQGIDDAYNKFKSMKGGHVADYIPELGKVDPNLFAIVVVTADGQIASIGNVDVPFAMESVSKPFVYALALQENGGHDLAEKIGMNATGQPFNSIMAIQQSPNHLQNPLVNAGAIQVTSYVKGSDSENKWNNVLSFMQRLSGSSLPLGQSVYQSETATNLHNRAIVALLNSYGMINGDPDDALDRYTKACSIMVTAKQLGIMGSVLANKGMNPVTHEQVISPRLVRDVLSVMTTSGLYENSGAWWYAVGLPAKSGVSGVILAIDPGKMAIVVYSPPLDDAGNSVRAQAVITYLAERWQLHLLDD